jgi:pimeloyl-ACP methyl ester carboxylesterase
MNTSLPTVIFLPGTLCTQTTFEHQISSLQAAANTRIIPLTKGSTIHESATWVLEQVSTPFALVGFSQGAIVALEIMRLAAERVTKLCLISANPKGPTPAQLETWKTWQQEVQAGNFNNIIEKFPNNVHPEKRHDQPLREAILAMARETGEQGFITQLQALASRIDSRPHLANITCPTLLVAGRQDTVTPLAFHQEINSFIPQAVLVPIEEAGHYVPLEQPQAVTTLLHYWLAKEH